jgi:hypothetical protein
MAGNPRLSSVDHEAEVIEVYGSIKRTAAAGNSSVEFVARPPKIITVEGGSESHLQLELRDDEGISTGAQVCAVADFGGRAAAAAGRHMWASDLRPGG